MGGLVEGQAVLARFFSTPRLGQAYASSKQLFDYMCYHLHGLPEACGCWLLEMHT